MFLIDTATVGLFSIKLYLETEAVHAFLVIGEVVIVDPVGNSMLFLWHRIIISSDELVRFVVGVVVVLSFFNACQEIWENVNFKEDSRENLDFYIILRAVTKEIVGASENTQIWLGDEDLFHVGL